MTVDYSKPASHVMNDYLREHGGDYRLALLVSKLNNPRFVARLAAFVPWSKSGIAQQVIPAARQIISSAQLMASRHNDTLTRPVKTVYATSAVLQCPDEFDIIVEALGIMNDQALNEVIDLAALKRLRDWILIETLRVEAATYGIVVTHPDTD